MAGNDWSLPTEVEIGGKTYDINTDYRDIREIMEYMEQEPDEQLRCHIVLALFYEQYDEMPSEHWQEAIEYLYQFVGCFEVDDEHQQPKNIDWNLDGNMILAEVNKIIGCEVRALPYMHWFTFIGFFYAIGEGQLATIVSIRTKIRKREELSKWEKEFYRDNRKRIDLPEKYTAEEEAELERLRKLTGRR